MMYLQALSQAINRQVYRVSTNHHGYVDSMYNNQIGGMMWSLISIIVLQSCPLNHSTYNILIYTLLSNRCKIWNTMVRFMGRIGDELARGLLEFLLRSPEDKVSRP